MQTIRPRNAHTWAPRASSPGGGGDCNSHLPLFPEHAPVCKGEPLATRLQPPPQTLVTTNGLLHLQSGLCGNHRGLGSPTEHASEVCLRSGMAQSAVPHLHGAGLPPTPEWLPCTDQERVSCTDQEQVSCTDQERVSGGVTGRVRIHAGPSGSLLRSPALREGVWASRNKVIPGRWVASLAASLAGQAQTCEGGGHGGQEARSNSPAVHAGGPGGRAPFQSQSQRAASDCMRLHVAREACLPGQGLRYSSLCLFLVRKQPGPRVLPQGLSLATLLQGRRIGLRAAWLLRRVTRQPHVQTWGLHCMSWCVSRTHACKEGRVPGTSGISWRLWPASGACVGTVQSCKAGGMGQAPSALRRGNGPPVAGVPLHFTSCWAGSCLGLPRLFLGLRPWRHPGREGAHEASAVTSIIFHSEHMTRLVSQDLFLIWSLLLLSELGDF